MSLSPKKINAQNLAETVIRNLSKRQIAGYYAQDKDEALEIACRFLQPGSSVSWGMTVAVHSVSSQNGMQV